MKEPIYFAQVREDAEIERAVVAATRAKRIVTIASGGCTALSLLTDSVGSVSAVDANPAQCALVELRRAALVELSRHQHLAFIGEAESPARVSVYEDSLRKHLPSYAQAYWDERADAIAAGINQAGVTERFYRFLGENLRRSVLHEDVWQELFSVRKDLSAQAQFFKRHFDTDSFRTALRVLLSKTTHLEFFPATMFHQVSEHHFGDFFWERLTTSVATRSQRDNYFLHQVVFGRYLLDRPRGTPHYLTVEGYAEAQRNAHKLGVHTEQIDAFLSRQRDLDAVLLSNVFDWATRDEGEQIGERAVRSLAPGAALVFRHMLANPALPEAVRRCTSMDEEWGRALLGEERSMLYRRVVVARRSS